MNSIIITKSAKKSNKFYYKLNKYCHKNVILFKPLKL